MSTFRPHSRYFGIAVLLAMSLHATAGPGDLDATFGSAGVAQLALPGVFTYLTSIDSIALQPDGKIIGGGPDNTIPRRTAIVRWLADGMLDASFGSSGLIFPAELPSEKVLVAAQADGKIVAAVTASADSGTKVTVYRFLAGGVKDTAFGTGGETALTHVAGGAEAAFSLLVQDDGRIVVAGKSGNIPMVARLTSAGAMDAAFGAGGLVTVATPAGTFFRITSAAQQPDGRIVCAGHDARASGALSPFLMQLMPGGTLDTQFTGGGIFSVFASGEFNALALSGDGTIFAAGLSQNSILVVARNADGSANTRFGNNGSATFRAGGVDRVNSLALQSNGRIVMSGETLQNGRVTAVSLGIRGHAVLDTSFGDGGANYHSFGSDSSVVNAVLALPDGKLLVAGRRYLNSSGNAVMHRLEADAARTPLETWRLTHFGSAVNSGPGADRADPDGDGVPNLMEYAFDLLPNSAASRAVPIPAVRSGTLSVTYQDPNSVAKGISFGGEASATLAAGSWVSLANTGSGSQFTFGIPQAGNPRAFLRIRALLNP